MGAKQGENTRGKYRGAIQGEKHRKKEFLKRKKIRLSSSETTKKFKRLKCKKKKKRGKNAVK